MPLRLPPPRQQPEKKEQATICEVLERVGAKVYVLGTKRPAGDFQGTRQTPGIPDLLAFLPVNFGPSVQLWIEVKARRGRMRPAQVEFLRQCQDADQPHVAGGIDAVIAYLTNGGWLK